MTLVTRKSDIYNCFNLLHDVSLLCTMVKFECKNLLEVDVFLTKLLSLWEVFLKFEL